MTSDDIGTHRCDDACACPVHGTPMWYWAAGDKHACQDSNCEHAGGLRICPLDGQRLSSVRRSIGESTVFTHVNGLQHGGVLSDLRVDDVVRALCQACQTMQPFGEDLAVVAHAGIRDERCPGTGSVCTYPLWAATEQDMRDEGRVVT